jgi:CBS domain-containing protein
MGFMQIVMTTVGEIMKDAIMVDTKISVRDAVIMMKKEKIGSVLVSTNSSAIGIVTSTDVLNKAVAERKDLDKTTVEEIMSSPLITATPDTELREAAEILKRNNIKKLPVADKGDLLGIVTASDILESDPEYFNALINLVVSKQQEIGG